MGYVNLSLKEDSIRMSTSWTDQLFVTKLPASSVMVSSSFCVPVEIKFVASKEFSPLIAVPVAITLFPIFQVYVPSVIASPEESDPEKLYLMMALSFAVTINGDLVIYSIFRVLVVALPPPPPTILN